jgi:glycosyltransferase involved in cell wall biosynthesis
MFSYRFSILPLIVLKAISFSGKIVLAPRGMLHAGALGLKSFKKKIFLKVFRALNFHKALYFHATDMQEVTDINCVFPEARVMHAENIPRINSEPLGREKTGGRLRLIFISRIHPTKNLLFLLEVLAGSSLNGDLEVGIYGNPEQSGYFEKCMILMQKIPKNILVEYKGGVPAHLVFNTIEKYHAFVLPTLGENFGHAIFEALSCGLPVVISDRTPWRNLNSLHAGWDISLSDKDGFERAIQELIDMTEETYNYWSNQSRSLAQEYMQQSNFDLKYSALFS